MRRLPLRTVLALLLGPALASADGGFALRLDGAEAGTVRFVAAGEGPARRATVTTAEPSAVVLATVRALASGRAARQTSLVVSTDAVTLKADDARLLEARLPGYAGGPTDLALVFATTKTTTSPTFRVAPHGTRRAGATLSGFRLSVGDLPTSEATRLAGVVLSSSDTGAKASPLLFDVPSRDAPRFVAWAKKRTPQGASIEYVGANGEVILDLRLGACAATSASVDGPVTHVAVACGRTIGA